MSRYSTALDADEIVFARYVAVHGKDQSLHGTNLYSVTKMKLLKDLPGMVVLGCVVKTDKKRQKQGEDQDFGVIKIMFYVLFDKHQTDHIKNEFPETTGKFFEHNGKDAVILNWIEFKRVWQIK